jgi:heme/copper-type cytochrome/quinol oxidase subunit 2
LGECQECAKLSSRQMVAILKNLKCKIYFWFVKILVGVITWFHVCYFIVLIYSLLFYNVENSKNKEKPLNESVCPNLSGTVFPHIIIYILWSVNLFLWR